MFFYSCSTGNPEGTDFTIFLYSEKEWSREDFKDLCEALIVETLEEAYAEKKRAWIGSLNTESLIAKFKDKGFNIVKETAGYYLEPYWGKESVKSEALKGWLNGKDDEMDKMEAEYKALEEKEKLGYGPV